jgi:hypothetical protein
MNQIDKQPRELDRWENEGGALPAEGSRAGTPVRTLEKGLMPSAGDDLVKAKIGPTRRGAHDLFFADLMRKAVKVLKNLDATGGHGEAHTDVQREAMTVLMRQHFVNRTIYKAGLVIYEITNAGRQYVHDLPA